MLGNSIARSRLCSCTAFMAWRASLYNQAESRSAINVLGHFYRAISCPQTREVKGVGQVPGPLLQNWSLFRNGWNSTKHCRVPWQLPLWSFERPGCCVCPAGGVKGMVPPSDVPLQACSRPSWDKSLASWKKRGSSFQNFQHWSYLYITLLSFVSILPSWYIYSIYI